MSVRIEVREFNGSLIDERIVKAGPTFADAAMEIWPEGFPGSTPVIIDPNGELASTEAAVNVVMRDGEVWQIVLKPQYAAALAFLAKPILGVAMGYWILSAVTLAASFLMAPKIPNNSSASYEWDDDRPQFYSGQTNQLRPGRRVPDVFGRMRVYPDLIAPAATTYTGTQQQIRELYVVSRGTCTVSDLKFHDEGIEDVPNSNYTVHYPGMPFPQDFPIIRTNAFVGAIELPAENEQISAGFTWEFRTAGWVYVNANGYWEYLRSKVGRAVYAVGVTPANTRPQYITGVSADGRYLYVSPSFEVNQDISDGSASFSELNYASLDTSGNLRVYNTNWTAITETRRVAEDDYVQVTVGWVSTAKLVAPFPSQVQLMNTSSRSVRTFTVSSDGLMRTNSASKPVIGNYWAIAVSGDNFGYNPAIPGSGYTSGIFGVPGTAREIWFDFEFPGGLYRQSAGQSPQPTSVQIEISYRPKGGSSWFTTVATFADKTRTARRFTHKVGVQSAPQQEWECYCRRVTPYTPETPEAVVVDQVQWIGLHARQWTDKLNNDVLDVTLVEMTMNTQNLAQSGQNRRFNCVAQRQLYRYETNDFGPTSSVLNAMIQTIVNDAKYDPADVDFASLAAIQNQLDVIPSPGTGEFNGIIDQTMTAEDQMNIIAQPFRIIVYRRATSIYFKRLKSDITPVTLINARNKIAPESRSLIFSERNDPDAITLRYQDQYDNWNEASFTYPENITPIQPEEQTVLGVTSPDVVKRMAVYLWEKKRREKDTITVEVTEEMALLGPGDVVAITDHLLEEPPLEGEIVKVVGTTFTFDQVIPAGTYTARVRARSGAAVKQTTLTVTTPSSTLTVAGWGVQDTIKDADTVGLLYALHKNTDDRSDLFYVIGVRPTRDGPVTLDLVKYDDAVFDIDTYVKGT